MSPIDITWLHVESSSKCNAACPACPRNNNGVGLAPGVIESDLSTERFISVVDSLPALKTVQFCGNFGDPIAGKNFLELIDVCTKKKIKIQVHTNGGLRSKNWWVTLAKKLSVVDHHVWFGIDGIGSTHEIYRQGTDYNKIINNATAFINAGGYATWQFIPFEHNQHQIKEAIKLSQQLNFKKFKLVKLFRNKKKAIHWKTNKEFELAPPSDIVEMIRLPGSKEPPTPELCMHMTPQPSVYLNAQGGLSWCCYRIDLNARDVEKVLNESLDFEHRTCVINCGRKET